MSERIELARRIIAEKLQAHEVIDPDEMAELTGIMAPERAAARLWRTTYFRSLTHRVARQQGIEVISIGGRVKPIETDEERDLAQRRASRQLSGQAKRRKRIRATDPNQIRFNLEEVSAHAGDTAAKHPASAAV